MTNNIASILNSILSEYHDRHDLKQVPIKVDYLRPIIEQRGFVDRIFWEKYDYPARNIAASVSVFEGSLGLYALGTDYARIQYSNSLNFCWERFAICKEMLHCLIDEQPQNRVTNIADLMKLAEYLVTDIPATIEPFAPHTTEDVAQILALEVLFPMELRIKHKDAFECGELTPLQLALRYRIPEEFARLAMYPTYFQKIHELRKGSLVDI